MTEVIKSEHLSPKFRWPRSLIILGVGAHQYKEFLRNHFYLTMKYFHPDLSPSEGDNAQGGESLSGWWKLHCQTLDLNPTEVLLEILELHIQQYCTPSSKRQMGEYVLVSETYKISAKAHYNWQHFAAHNLRYGVPSRFSLFGHVANPEFPSAKQSFPWYELVYLKIFARNSCRKWQMA